MEGSAWAQSLKGCEGHWLLPLDNSDFNQSSLEAMSQ